MEKITHRTVHELHKQALFDGDSVSEDTVEIVKIIGGIDKILMDYLTKPQLISSINNNKLQQLHGIISTPKHFRLKNKQTARAQNAIISPTGSDQEGIANVLILNNNDTWLYSLFNKDIDDKLYLFVWHKITIISVSVICTLGFLLYSLFPTNRPIVVLDIILTALLTPYMSLLILSANTAVSSFILKSFEFYLKMYYVAVYFGAATVFWLVIQEPDEHELYDAIHKKLMIVAWSASIPFYVLVQAFIFSLDAYNINWIIKSLLPAFSAVNYLFLWIQSTLLIYSTDKQDVSIIKITNNIHISLYSQQQGASFVISIFCFKQAFMTWYRQRQKYKNKKAMTIKTVPRLHWEMYKTTADIKNLSQNIEIEMAQKVTSQLQETTMEIKMHQIKKSDRQRDISISSNKNANEDSLSV